MTFTEVLQLTPEEIQAYLDDQLANAPEDVRAVVASVDYVEPGSIRDPACGYYVMLGAYNGDRETVEVAFEVRPAAEFPLSLLLKLL